jgi:hypothetical protein
MRNRFVPESRVLTRGAKDGGGGPLTGVSEYGGSRVTPAEAGAGVSTMVTYPPPLSQSRCASSG